jgi:hypothetical protein
MNRRPDPPESDRDCPNCGEKLYPGLRPCGGPTSGTITRTFGDAIDIFGTGGEPPRGVETVATTMQTPGDLIFPGCPIHGMGCPPSCPVLQAYDAAKKEIR